MKTLKAKRAIVQMQYLLESLLEVYSNATKESQKYYLKLELLQMIDDNILSLKDTIDYMSLRSDDFADFLSLLIDIKPTRSSKKSIYKNKQLDRTPSDLRVFICNGQEFDDD